jgi:hypothetical protein
MKLLKGKWSTDALGNAVLNEGFYMIRSIAESIELMMATDTIFYPILQSNHLISTLIFSKFS